MDKSGHGTEVAATAAGYSIEKEGFSGAAPEAELVVVKLKQAKRYLRDLYLLPQEADIYQEDDIMLAIAYVLRVAAENQKPLSICIGL
ncbi:S8 family serine peptidase, partial [Bilophila wadsworthia]